MNYYVARDGKQYGPYSAETAQRYLAEGSLLPSDYAREESAQTWSTLAQLFPQAPAAVAAAPQAGAAAAPAYAYTPQTAQAQYAGQPQVLAQPQVQGQPYAPPYAPQYPSNMQLVPPSLHWAVVLVLSMFTGIFGTIWAFVQAAWVKKIDPQSKAIALYVVWAVTLVIFMFCWVAGAAMVSTGQNNTGAGLMGFAAFVYFVGLVFLMVGVFSVRRSMLNYYNSVEPINLRLSGVMTFFFNILYLQYHMTRIARWKQTGILTA